jgi:hypothetical protein
MAEKKLHFNEMMMISAFIGGVMVSMVDSWFSQVKPNTI